MRNQLARLLFSTFHTHDNYILLLSDIGNYTFRDIKDNFPNRFYDLGICEQSIIGIAAGLSAKGFRSIIYGIAPFIVERCYEQLKLDINFQQSNCIIISVGGSYDYGKLGYTHHCYSDISLIRNLQNIDIVIPGNVRELEKFFNLIDKENKTSFYIKIHEKMHLIDIGNIENIYDSYVISNGAKGVIFVCGHLLDEVYANNKEEYSIVYVPVISNKLNTNNIIQYCSNFEDNIIVVEENSVIGGLGDFISDICSKNNLKCRIRKIGITKNIIENYCSANDIRTILSLDSRSLKFA